MGWGKTGTRAVTRSGTMGVLTHPDGRRCPVRVPAPCYQLEPLLAEFLPHLRHAQRTVLGMWVQGAVLAGNACQNAVLNALEPTGHPRHATRQRLREWTYDGADRAAPCGTDLEVAACFAPLLRWVLSWWSGETLPLAIDATSLGTRWVIIAVCVLYRGGAIPVAWHVTPGPGHGPWMAPIQALLTQLAPAVPPTMTVLVLTDRGLWSPRLWRSITAIGWHPLMRIRPDATFAPLGSHRRPARDLVPGAGHAWVGAGTAFKHRDVRRRGTLVVVWDTGQREPWLVLTDLDPEAVGVVWYGRWAWSGTGCGSGSSWASACSRAWAGSGSGCAGRTPRGWSGTGWCWPWRPWSPWPMAPASRMPRRTVWLPPPCARRAPCPRAPGTAPPASSPAGGPGCARG